MVKSCPAQELGKRMSKATGSIASPHEVKPSRYGHRQDGSPRRRLDDAITRARDCLLDRQHADGHWVGELQGDTILESEYILLMAFLGREGEEKVAKAARYLLTQQLPEGGWNNYPDGPADLSVSVKAYFALKLAGHDLGLPYMCRARA